MTEDVIPVLCFDREIPQRGTIPVRTIHWNLNVFNVRPMKGRKNPPNIFERLPLLEDDSFLCTCDNLPRGLHKYIREAPCFTLPIDEF